ncbi:MAG: cupin domain-containing protein [Deltaproteobacteria bacterium]|jgi:quercetin dioxygenase-like cupin family protein
MKIVSLNDLPEEPVSHNPELRKKVMLKEGDLPACFMKFSQARFTSGQAAGAHAHADMYEVFLVEQGEGLIRIGKAEHPLHPGTCAVAEPGETHDLINTGSADLVITYFGVKTT